MCERYLLLYYRLQLDSRFWFWFGIDYVFELTMANGDATRSTTRGATSIVEAPAPAAAA